MVDPARVSASRSERRKARTTTAIMDAAERHFLERGFQNAKVDEIAEEADVAVGSVYNHFGSKEGLYRAALERRGHLRMLVLPQPREAEEALRESLDQVRKAMAAQERRTAALIEAAVRRGDARPLDSRRAAAFVWSSWPGPLALGERSDRELRAVLEAGLRVVLGGIASEESRESSELLRALLESTAPVQRRGEARWRPETVTRAA